MFVPGALKILIVGANGLDKLVTVGEQQPYYVLGCGQQRSRSKPCVGNGSDPTWNTAHKFNLTEEVGIAATVRDEVTKGIIGQGVIELARVRQYGKDEGAVVLMNLGNTPAGTIRYKLKFQPAADGVTAPQLVSASGSATQDAAASRFLSGPGAAPAGPAPAAAEDDLMLAAAANKVSLAKAAMQQLTAELAELTRAESAEQAPNAFEQHQQGQRQPPVHSRSVQERHRESNGTVLHQQRSLQSLSMNSVPSPVAVSPAMSPRMSGAGGPPRAADLAGWNTNWQGHSSSGRYPGHPAASAGDRLSTEDLLATYCGRAVSVEQHDLSAGLSSTKQLMQQLQEALAAAHAEKVSAEDELSSVKQAMAIMSKQHYLDMKRVRDSATGAAAAHSEPGHTIMSMVDSHGNTGQKILASPHKQLQQQQQQQQRRSMEVVAASSKVTQTQQGTVAAAAAAGGEDVSSPLPAYKLQIQIHQLERQLAEQAAKTQEEIDKQQAQGAKIAELHRQLEAQSDAIKQAEANTRAAEMTAAEQATQAAAARQQLAAVQASSDSVSGKEAALSAELAALKSELSEALTEKSELEEALGLMEKNNSAQVTALQADLAQMQEEAAALKQVSNSEEVEYLQAQLRRTLRQVVELQHQVQVLQQNARQAAVASGGDVDDAEDHAVIKSEHELLMQELVSTKLELAQLKEQQLVTQRQLFKAQEILRRESSGGVC